MELTVLATTTRLLRTATAVLSVGLLTAACSGGDADADSDGEGGSELDGVSITVGSKDFTENILIRQMIAQALAAEGADVTDETNLGGTSVNRTALLAGEIDVYPEYDGTAWTVHLGQQDPSGDRQELYDVTSAMDLADNGIRWVGLSPFNDTYGFAANGDLAEAEGGFDLQAMADYMAATPDASLCMETEFPDRPDGLILFTEATGYAVPQSQIQILDTGLIYTETANGSCDFGEIFTTDGRINALNLSLVEDPGVFILYNISFTWMDATFQEHADTYQRLVDAILEPLDETKMAELNGLVDVLALDVDQAVELGHLRLVERLEDRIHEALVGVGMLLERRVHPGERDVVQDEDARVLNQAEVQGVDPPVRGEDLAEVAGAVGRLGVDQAGVKDLDLALRDRIPGGLGEEDQAVGAIRELRLHAQAGVRGGRHVVRHRLQVEPALGLSQVTIGREAVGVVER